MSAEATTSGRHNDFVGGDASVGRIPGAEKATTGHYYVAVDPRAPRPGKSEKRAEEHLPPPTGRDAPPAPGPAPRMHPAFEDSGAVIDRDPFATPVTAADTMTGATSAEVNRGLGHPGQGMSSAEAHHDGKPHQKRAMQGTDAFGSGEIPRDV